MFICESRIDHHTHNRLARPVVLFALVALSLCAQQSAKADVVTDWNAITTATVTGSPPQQARFASITHAAVFDAVNAIDRRYTVYAVSPPVTLPASQGAAAAAAAHGVL